MAEEVDGLTEEQREVARGLAAEIIRGYRDGEELCTPSQAAIDASMHRITGEDIPAQQMPMLREELNLFGEDARRVHIDTSAMAPEFRVLIIGLGMSGIAAGPCMKTERSVQSPPRGCSRSRVRCIAFTIGASCWPTYPIDCANCSMRKTRS